METDNATGSSDPVAQEQHFSAENENQIDDKAIDDQTDLNVKNEAKFRENFYRLIISQLFYDGYQHIAVGLSGSVQVIPLPYINIVYEQCLIRTTLQGLASMSTIQSPVELGQTWTTNRARQQVLSQFGGRIEHSGFGSLQKSSRY